MNKQFFFLVSILPLLFFSCSTNEITPLNIEKRLIATDTTMIIDGCYNIAFIYDRMLVLIANCDEHFFHIYDKETLNFIKKFGIKGRGPYEFNFPFPFLTNTTINPMESVFEFYDVNMPKITEINFNSLILYEDLSLGIASKDIDVNLFSCDMLNRLNNNKIAGINIDADLSKGMFFIYDIKTRKKQWISYYPKVRLEKIFIHNAYFGLLCSNGETIIYASKYFDEILFFNANGELEKEFYFSKIQKPTPSKQYSGIAYESTVYSTDIYGTSEYCYVLRLMQPGTKLQKLHTSQLKSETIPGQILVFDWDGNLVNTYQVDSLPLSFCVDESTNTMYCILFNNKPDEYIKIVRYKIR